MLAFSPGQSHPAVSTPMHMAKSLGSLPVHRLPAALSVCILLAAAALAAGCGEGGVGKGATVSVYVVKPLCAAAARELKKEGKQVGEVQVGIVCLPPVESDGRIQLATVGANARRATEDSTSVAYLESPSPANRFSEPILESPGVGWLYISSVSQGMRRVIAAIHEASSSSFRESVRNSLDG